MILVVRFLGLLIFAAAAHFTDGLGLAALGAGAAIGWLRWSSLLLLVLALGLGAYASEIYAHATSAGKLAGAMGNFAFEVMVFWALGMVGRIVAGLLHKRMGKEF